MKRDLRHLTLLLASLALLAGLGASNSARQQAGSQQVSDFSGLTLEIATTNKKDFVRLEPVAITLTLSNKTDQTILGHGALKFSDNFVRLFVTPEGGAAGEVRQLSSFPKQVFVSPVEMKPGESYQAKELLALDLDRIFPEPGNYQIHAVLIDPNSRLEVKSNALSIRILEPEGIDRQAFEYIRANSKGASVLSGRYLSGQEKARKVLERLALSYDKSVYGDYAAYLLGELYFAQEEYDKASRQFSRLAKKADFALADKAAEYLAEAKQRQKE